jgi:hypothetical protein
MPTKITIQALIDRNNYWADRIDVNFIPENQEVTDSKETLLLK